MKQKKKIKLYHTTVAKLSTIYLKYLLHVSHCGSNYYFLCYKVNKLIFKNSNFIKVTEIICKYIGIQSKPEMYPASYSFTLEKSSEFIFCKSSHTSNKLGKLII